TARSTWSSFVTSQIAACALPPFRLISETNDSSREPSRATHATLSPRFDSASALARPIPLDAPVMNATFGDMGAIGELYQSFPGKCRPSLMVRLLAYRGPMAVSRAEIIERNLQARLEAWIASPPPPRRGPAAAVREGITLTSADAGQCLRAMFESRALD